MIKFFHLALLIIGISTFTFSQGIKQTHHDFSGQAWSNHEYCKPCHTPHNADLTVPLSPLWNHQLTNAVFNLYSSATMNSFPGQPDRTSKLCLSCHDGTIAIENHGGVNTGTSFMPSPGLISTDLSNDHPISIVYDAALAATDPGLKDPTTTMSGLGGTITQDLLKNGYMECTSCHDPHISRNISGCTGCHILHPQFHTVTVSIWKSNTNSELCLTCHNK